MTKRYLWWPISFAWGKPPLSLSAWQLIARAWDSRRWTLTLPALLCQQEALLVHRAATRRIWHGWEQFTRDGVTWFGWTLHFGHLKVMFGKGRSA